MLPAEQSRLPTKVKVHAPMDRRPHEHFADASPLLFHSDRRKRQAVFPDACSNTQDEE